MENFGAIIWVIVIISWVLRFIGKLSSGSKGNGKRKEIEKKVADFFSENFTQGEEKTTQEKKNLLSQKQSSDDKWIPAYEEPESKPLQENTVYNDKIINKKINNSVSGVNSKKDKEYTSHKNDSRRKSYLSEENFSSDDLIKGVIFKEILDQPRAKRPYKPFS